MFGKKIQIFFSGVIVATGIFFCCFLVKAWDPPVVAPPGGNVDTPINISANAQIKTGVITAGGIGSTGGIIAAGDITSTAGNGFHMVPRGAIIMWSGTIASIPSGWALCDGNNGTPNLTNRFIRSVSGAGENPGSTGGADSSAHSHGYSCLPRHNHSTSVSVSPNPHSHGIRYFNNVGAAGANTALISAGGTSVGTAVQSTFLSIGVSVNNRGSVSCATGAATVSRLPRYYELAFIMKL